MTAITGLPYIWPQSSSWLGLDGNWSTIPISVGSPPQQFNVLPSTSGSQIWLPVPEGCLWLAADSLNCARSRGVSPASSSPGWNVSASSKWHQLGLYQLDLERELYGRDQNGLFGLDQVTLNNLSASVAISDQLVAGIASKDFWLGTLGLSDLGSNLDLVNYEIPSLLTTLSSKQMLPSNSYAYAAGAAYRSSPASLVLGGYDEAAFVANNLTFNIPKSRTLLVDVVSIAAIDTLQGTASMLTGTPGLTMRIDSAVSQLWLPLGVCESMARAFGLIYDNATNLYLVNSTTHARLQELNPQLTFILSPSPSSSETLNIVLPYAALDLTIGLPTYNTTYRYFPIRRAANETQYVLGRAFLQEGYLIVDWERNNFSLSQMSREGSKAQSVVPILSSNASSMPQTDRSRLSVGAIAGVALGVGGLALVVLIGSLCWRRSRRCKTQCTVDDEAIAQECPEDRTTWNSAAWSDEKSNVELMSEAVHELNAGQKDTYQVMSKEIFELDATSPSSELTGDSPAMLPVFEK